MNNLCLLLPAIAFSMFVAASKYSAGALIFLGGRAEEGLAGDAGEVSAAVAHAPREQDRGGCAIVRFVVLPHVPMFPCPRALPHVPLSFVPTSPSPFKKQPETACLCLALFAHCMTGISHGFLFLPDCRVSGSFCNMHCFAMLYSQGVTLDAPHPGCRPTRTQDPTPKSNEQTLQGTQTFLSATTPRINTYMIALH